MVELRPDDAVVEIIISKNRADQLQISLSEANKESGQMQKEIDLLNEKLSSVTIVGVDSCSGLTRLTAPSDAWHKAHPRASNFLFSLKEWERTKAHLTEVLFPEISMGRPGKGDMSEFEGALSALMAWHGALKQELVALVFDVSCSAVA